MTVATVGHSNGPAEAFIDLLVGAGVDTVVDVRSQPSSSFAPHFSSGPLRDRLAQADLTYVWMGEQLGGRPDPRTGEGRVLYPDGLAARPDYRAVAACSWFADGIGRLGVALGQGRRVAVMCAEEDPTACHRRLLVARALTDPDWWDGPLGQVMGGRSWAVWHLRGDGTATRHVNDITLF